MVVLRSKLPPINSSILKVYSEVPYYLHIIALRFIDTAFDPLLTGCLLNILSTVSASVKEGAFYAY